MKLYCIVNPHAGRGTTGRMWSVIEENLKKIGCEIIVEFTQSIGHAERLAKKAEQLAVAGIVVVGGDGTINEVINGMVGSKLPLGLIPTGTGNDLSRTLNIPQDPLEAIIIMAKGNQQEINLAQADQRYFINVASVGFDASVVNWVNKRKLFKGPFAYYSAVFLNILRNKKYQLSIDIDGKKIEKICTLVAIANGKYYGAGFKIAPQANICDNLFDVVIVDDVYWLELLKNLHLIKEGKHISNPKVSIYQGQKVTINSTEKKVMVQADGEILENLPQTFKISDQSIKIFVP